MRLTKRICDELARQVVPTGQRTWHWDDEIPGFGLRHNATGRLSFVLKYRIRGDARQRLVTLGEWPTTAPDGARQEARQIKAAAALGIDLVAERRVELEAREAERKEAQKRAIPLVDILDEWRTVTEAQVAAREARGETVSHDREMLRLERRKLRPLLAGETVGELDPERFHAWVALEAHKGASTAKNFRSLVVRFTRFANATLTARGVPVRWPTTFDVKLAPRSRDHRFTLEEMARIWIAAGGLGRRGALVRLMMLTGCRRAEAQTAEWDHLRLTGAEGLGPHWEQPGRLTKNKRPHRVPLSPPALALFSWLPRRPGCPLIFPGRGGVPISGWTDVRSTLMRAAGVEEGTLHDFRRTMVSVLGDNGFDPHVADTLLNHAAATTMGGVMGVYQRSELWGKRVEAISLWTDLLMDAVSKAAGKPAAEDKWGFDSPFADVRIVRPKPAAGGADTSPPKRRSPRRRLVSARPEPVS